MSERSKSANKRRIQRMKIAQAPIEIEPQPQKEPEPIHIELKEQHRRPNLLPVLLASFISVMGTLAAVWITNSIIQTIAN